MKKSTAKETESLPKGNERILLVDDEPLVVDVTKIRLKKLGYEVTALTSSIAALESFRVQPEAFDLVITDQSMPKMSGVQLSKELLGIRSDISIILCTGYSSIVDAEKSKSIGIKGFIMKPVNQKELAVTIRNILDAGTTTG
jgi:DNA-binding NtrC family response regulator